MLEDRPRQWDGSVDEEMMEDYRPISVSAILSFCLGLLAIGAIWIPAVSLVGLFSVLVGLIALYFHSRNRTMLYWLAYIGIFVSVFSATWTQVARASYENYLMSTGDQFAQQWLELLKDGKVKEAICLRMDYLDRPLENADLDEYFLRTEAPAASSGFIPAPSEMLERFSKMRTIREIIEYGKRTTVTPIYDSNSVDTSNQGVAKVRCFYRIELEVTEENGKRRIREFDINVLLARKRFPTSVHWEVIALNNVTRPDPPESMMQAGVPETEASGELEE